jgi:hypothetical protein
MIGGAVIVVGLFGLASGCNQQISDQEWLEQLGIYFPHRNSISKAGSKGLVL